LKQVAYHSNMHYLLYVFSIVCKFTFKNYVSNLPKTLTGAFESRIDAVKVTSWKLVLS
jgi:hypothetical protein